MNNVWHTVSILIKDNKRGAKLGLKLIKTSNVPT